MDRGRRCPGVSNRRGIGRPPHNVEGRRCLKENTQIELQHKLGECIWWITILAERMDIDIQEAVESFLAKTESLLKP
jgi:NTP pyrophosphatase (non-canonical NTP hydrolase)